MKAALRAGHSVRALARSAASILIQEAGRERVSGDALDSDSIRNALKDVNVVIQTLGVDISPRAIFERTTLLSRSTRILVDAMKAAGVKRLIAVTGLGASDSRGHGGFLYDTLAFPLLLTRVYDDGDACRSRSLSPPDSTGPLCGQACSQTAPRLDNTAS